MLILENKNIVDISWQILLSGFVGAVVGAIITLIGAVFIANRNEKTRQRNALKGILAELEENRTIANNAHQDTPTKFNLSSWNDSKGYMLSLKDDTVRDSLCEAYSLMGKVNTTVERMIADPRSGGMGTYANKYTSQTQTAKTAIEDAIKKLSPLILSGP